MSITGRAGESLSASQHEAYWYKSIKFGCLEMTIRPPPGVSFPFKSFAGLPSVVTPRSVHFDVGWIDCVHELSFGSHRSNAKSNPLSSRLHSRLDRQFLRLTTPCSRSGGPSASQVVWIESMLQSTRYLYFTFMV